MKAALPTVQATVLGYVARNPGHHGYLLLRHFDGILGKSSIYLALSRLQERMLVASQVEVVHTSSRNRRCYHITEAGYAALARHKEATE